MPPEKPTKRSPRKKSPAKSSDSASKKASTSRSRKPTSAKAKSSGSRGSQGKGGDNGGGWLLWLRSEALVILAGAVTGLIVALGLLYADALHAVDAWEPAASQPTTLWSAPVRLRPGEHARRADVESDLRASGFEVARGGAGTFIAEGDSLRVCTTAVTVPVRQAAQCGTIQFKGDRVVSVDPADLLLPPTPLAVLGDVAGRRSPVILADLPEHLPLALLAIEDARFQDHGGVDPIGILRALWANLRGSSVQGGSTLTQQLAKNLFLSQQRTLRRKLREVFYAAALEHRYTKDELLELYLSEVYLGHIDGMPLHGVDQASRAWFGRAATHVTIAQAATLAGVIASPNIYSPLRNPEKALERRDRVIDRLAHYGVLDASQADEAKSEPLATLPAPVGTSWRLPWAVSAALRELEGLLPPGVPLGSGLDVYTTVQPHVQRAADAAVRDGLTELGTRYAQAQGAEAALAAVRVSDGAVIAVTGGRDYAASPFHRAVQAWRQAGSTAKPFLAMAALDADLELTLATLLPDEPIERTLDGKRWAPANHDGEFWGPIPLRRALEHSRNMPAILLYERIGSARSQQAFLDAGLSRATRLPSAALGAFPATPLEVAAAYTVFPGQGLAQRAHLISLVHDADGHTRFEVDARGQRMASPQAAALTRSALEGVVERGTGRALANHLSISGIGGKTGTTDNQRDAWFAGFDAEVSVAVWVGRDRDDLGMSGGRAALPIFGRFFASTGGARGAFTDPSDLLTADICAETGLRACRSCTEPYEERFRRGTIPTADCDTGEPPISADADADAVAEPDEDVEAPRRGRQRPNKRGRGRE